MMRTTVSILILFFGLVWTLSARPFRQVLTSAKQNVRVDSWQVTHREVTPESNTPWSVRKYTLHGGKQEGVDLIVVDNGKLVITLTPTRGMGVLEVKSGAIRLGWDSPVKEVVHPQFVRLDSRGGLGWLDGFNEWMVRCGLEFAGIPGKDQFVTNTGDVAEMNLTLHGKIANIPASEVEVIVDSEPPHRIRVRGVVYERMFYGPKLELIAELSTEPGSNTIRIEDTITNHGELEQEFQIIYHTNYGTPILERGAQVVAPVKQVTPMNDHAAKAVETYPEYVGPTKGFIEQVYLIHPYSDADGQTTVMLRNAAEDLATSLVWSTNQLPYLTVWKDTAAIEDGYVTGLEPGTGFPNNRRVERKFGRVPTLGAGQSQRFTLEFAIHEGKQEVARLAEKIGRIQASQATQVDTQPVKAD